MHRVAIRLMGVDYLHGHRDETGAVLDTCEPPGPAAAEHALQAFLAELHGLPKRIRAGWAAVRWLEDDRDDWRGPAWLFAVQAPVAGEFQVELTGEDASDWPPPELT